MRQFVHLHRHSEYSFLDGSGRANQYADLAAELGQPALALTDHGNLCGALHHIVACEAAGIKPIVGMEAYFRPDAKDHTPENKEYYHLVLLAKNEVGFRTLRRLSTQSYHEENFYYKPCVDWKMLEQEHEGLIASASCLSGFLPQMLMDGNELEAETYMKHMQKIFGDDFYFEIQPHDFDEQRQANGELISMAQKHSIPFIAAVDAHYPYKDWSTTHDVLVMINTGQSDSSRKEAEAKGDDYMAFSGDTFYLMHGDDLSDAFAKYHSIPQDIIDESIKNAVDIAETIDHYQVSKHTKIPKAASSLMEAEAIVREWCEEGLERIGKKDDEDYRERMETELAVLRDKKVLDYFVIIGDLVRWAKANGIRVGKGRGSAAGSLVSYLCRITAIDPIGYGLLFERFLNPTRSELPDIDIDFQHDRRHEVKAYLGQRWGEEYVADIIAFQTFGMRAALQSAARVKDVPYEVVMAVTKTMDDGSGDLKLADMVEINEGLADFALKYPDVWEHALRIEGQVKSTSKHAAGVVITDKPIAEYMPTMRGKDGSTVTQWSEKAEFPIITTYGFLKIDILGLDNLTIKDRALRLIEERTGDVIDFEDVNRFPEVADPYAADQAVIEAFGHRRNLGIFQFESSGISGLLADIKPTWIGDIIAANALYRPGPLEGGVAFEYGSRKNGHTPIVYWHAAVEPFLKETYGIMVYQEQIMQIVQALGDFTLAEADIVRKAMTKWQSTKLKDNTGRMEMQKLQLQFAEGCKKKGLTDAIAKDIWEKILQFSIYGFNKSHSAGYGLDAYFDQWLKMYHSLEMYSALMSEEELKVPQIIREAMGRGIKILPPDINESMGGFALVGNSIRFGFEGIKYVADAAIGEIMEKRPFKDLDDLEARCERRKVNARVKTSLTRCGAFDAWGLRDEWTEQEKSVAEKELLGYSLAGTDILQKHSGLIKEHCLEGPAFDKALDGEEVKVGGEIVQVKEIVTKKGDPMAFVRLMFGPDQFEATFFPGQYAQFRHILSEGNAILVMGEKDGSRSTVRVDHACTLQELVSLVKEKK